MLRYIEEDYKEAAAAYDLRYQHYLNDLHGYVDQALAARAPHFQQLLAHHCTDTFWEHF